MNPNTSDTASKTLGDFSTYWRKLVFSLLLASLFFSTSKPCNANPSSTTNKPTTVANTVLELQSLIKDAESGDPIAQYLIGIHYWHEKNFKQGILWMEKAAHNGNVYAQYKLGHEYGVGRKVGNNGQKSLKYFLLAVDQGYVPAQRRLGLYYNHGSIKGYPKDLKRALKYFHLAAEQGDLDSKGQLMFLYKDGDGKGNGIDLKKSLYWKNEIRGKGVAYKQWLGEKYSRHPLIVYAEEKRSELIGCLVGIHFCNEDIKVKELACTWPWIKLAADAGDMHAQYEMGGIYNGPSDEPIDSQKSLKYYLLSANQGYSSAQWSLGLKYMYGVDVPADPEQGLLWWEKAAKNGSFSATTDLADCYYYGNYGVTKDYKKAFKHYLTAAKKHGSLAQTQYTVGFMYMHGQGIIEDYKQGISWYETAAENGNTAAQVELGNIYYSGRKGAIKDYKKAFNYSLLAAKQNHTQSQYLVGFMYMRGQGVIEDYKAGIGWLKKSALQGL